MHASLLFLGTGASLGVPLVGCNCPVCTSNNSRNKRFRSSALLTNGEKKLLIDCGPDFRMQALNHNIKNLDGCLITHIHHDHTASLDEVRVFNYFNKKSLPCLMSSETAFDVRKRFDYLFLETENAKRAISTLDIKELPADRGEIRFEGIDIKYLSYEQAGTKVTGYRFNELAYISDIRDYPETIFEDLEDVDFLILSALRFTKSNLHFSIDEAIDFSKKTGAKKTYLTHLSHEIEHERTSALLPPNVHLAYDGLTLPFRNI